MARIVTSPHEAGCTTVANFVRYCEQADYKPDIETFMEILGQQVAAEITEFLNIASNQAIEKAAADAKDAGDTEGDVSVTINMAEMPVAIKSAIVAGYAFRIWEESREK